jgi:predicted membrane chloride channel (bestrophin family)
MGSDETLDLAPFVGCGVSFYLGLFQVFKETKSYDRFYVGLSIAYVRT